MRMTRSLVDGNAVQLKSLVATSTVCGSSVRFLIQHSVCLWSMMAYKTLMYSAGL